MDSHIYGIDKTKYVYVLDRAGRPLMPTRRYGHVEKLLRSGKARIAGRVPFVIQLKYDTPGITQPLYGGTDPGRTNIGNAVVTSDGTVVYKDHVTTRNKDIPKLMSERKSHRQASRRGERLARKRIAKRLGTTRKFLEGRKLPGCDEPVMLKDIINTEARFNSRKRPAGWLTPTARQLMQTHVGMIRRICRILPVSSWTLEANRFAFMLMEDGSVRGVDFQNGRMKGYPSVEAYIYAMQEGRCCLCGRPIEHYHHIVPKSHGGSDRPDNIAGLCGQCHSEVHVHEAELSLIGEKKKYGTLSVLNQAVPYIAGELEAMFCEGFSICTGYETSASRDLYSISKDHDNDAVCIAMYMSGADTVSDNVETYEVKQFRRHDRANIKAQRERAYYMDGKAVAKNRRPRFEQSGPALSDLSLSRQELSKLTVKKSRRYYNDKDRIMPGAEFLYEERRYILSGSLSNGKYFRAVGDTKTNCPASKCLVIRKNTGLVYLN